MFGLGSPDADLQVVGGVGTALNGQIGRFLLVQND